MQILSKKSLGINLFIFSVFLLGACSSTQAVPTSVIVEASHTLQPTEVVTEILITKSPTPMKTNTVSPTESRKEKKTATQTAASTDAVPAPSLANVLSISVSGGENAYQFAVEIRSPDEGCEQYADWWEVVSEDGELVYRRILAHSHVGEQPFTRSGGPLAISADTVVIVRAHMYPDGYGGVAFRGSVENGFESVQLEPNFAEGLDKVEPLPSGCGF